LKDKNGDEILVGARVKVAFESRWHNGTYMPGNRYRGFVSKIEDEYVVVDVNGTLCYAKPINCETVRVAKKVRENYEKRKKRRF
jgi:hypothetical protein